MYEVQVYVPSEPYDASRGTEWRAHTVIEQLETEQAELQEARKIRDGLQSFYTQVQIVKWGLGGGTGQIVV
jgi:hypothetical protein